jgi:hypothetical protein
MRILSEQVALWAKQSGVFPVSFKRAVSQKDLVIWAGFQVLQVQDDYSRKNGTVTILIRLLLFCCINSHSERRLCTFLGHCKCQEVSGVQ